jgi:hypothetical protein
MEHDVSHVHADATKRDFFAQEHASNSRSKQLTDLGRTLEECKILLFLQETDLEVREAILVEEQERDLCPTDGRDLSLELDSARLYVDRISDERTTEAK